VKTKRDYVKWQPFNAVVPGEYMVNEVLKEKNMIEMPILSEDQFNILQDKIVKAWRRKEVIFLTYYKSGKVFKKKGQIKIFRPENHKIVLNDGFYLYFEQIIDIF